jgi:D-3-phosphoglycerate dehydrogenase
MAKNVVLLTAPYMIPFVDRFKPVFDDFDLEVIVPEVNERFEAEDILRYAGQFDGTICGDDRYGADVIAACLPRLKVISKWGTGIDSIDKKSANEMGVMVGNTPDAFTIPVSDSVLAYILAFSRRQLWMDKAMKAGEWKKIPGKALCESTLGIVGVGNIGQSVARKAKAFGMTLLGCDPKEPSPSFVVETGIEMTSYEDLLKRSDFVSMNTDLNPTSVGMMNAAAMKLMKPSAVLINTSRGPVVKEVDLIAALQNGEIAGAGLDVFEYEPLPVDSPLKKMDQVLLAPHNSNSSPMAWERVHWSTVRNLLVGLGLDAEKLDPNNYSID